MSVWEWQYALGFACGLVVGALLGALAWWHLSAADRLQDTQIAYKDGEHAGQLEGYARGVASQAEIQRAKDSARAKKAAGTRKARRVA